MSILLRIANGIIRSSCRRESHRFFRNTASLRACQEKKLETYILQNKDTDFGRAHNFAAINSYEEYARRVPVLTYADYEGYVSRIRNGEGNVLTRAPVLLLEPTSGTSSGTKLIPYTADLQREYMAGVKPWLSNVYSHYPGLRGGSSYWSISPVASGAGDRDSDQSESSVIPLGFEDDSGYFGNLQSVLQKVFPVPRGVRTIRHLENFRYITCLLLLASERLSLISVWNPSFLTILMDYLNGHRELMIKSCTDRRLYWPIREDTPNIRVSFSRRRVKKIQRLEDPEFPPALLWPNLELISCWTEGMSSLSLEDMKGYFPGVEIQGKGLLATEGIISFPLIESGGAVLAANSHVYEFADQESGNVLPAWRITEGRRYSVIMTTAGGLYRYSLGDVVEVRGRYKGLPVLSFLGRNSTMDIAGEKISDLFAAGVISELLPARRKGFALLAPVFEDNGFGYILITDIAGADEMMCQRLEKGLKKNFHYAYARDLGQLRHSEIYLWKGKEPAEKRFSDFLVSKGQCAGDVKPRALYTGTDILECFAPGECICISP